MSWIDEIRQAAISLNGGAPLPRRGRLNFVSKIMSFVDNQVGYPPVNGDYSPRLDATWNDQAGNLFWWGVDAPAAVGDRYVWPNGSILSGASGYAPIVTDRDVRYTSLSFTCRLAGPPQALVCTVQKLVGVGAGAVPQDTPFRLTIPANTPANSSIRQDLSDRPVLISAFTPLVLRVVQAGTGVVSGWWPNWSLN
jgi:hypothetical protein